VDNIFNFDQSAYQDDSPLPVPHPIANCVCDMDNRRQRDKRLAQQASILNDSEQSLVSFATVQQPFRAGGVRAGAAGSGLLPDDDAWSPDALDDDDESGDNDDDGDNDADIKLNDSERNAIGTRIRNPLLPDDEQQDEEQDYIDDATAAKLGLGDPSLGVPRTFPHGYSAAHVDNIEFSSDAQRRAAFFYMQQRGGEVSREARAASKIAKASGTKRDHARAAAAHAAAAEQHRDEGNHDIAEAHRVAQEWHRRRSRRSGNKAKGIRNVSLLAMQCSDKAMQTGTVQAHTDAYVVNQLAQAEMQLRGDEAMAQRHHEAAAYHRNVVAQMRGLTHNAAAQQPRPVSYMGAGVVPEGIVYDGLEYHGGITSNVFGVGDDMDGPLPTPTMGYGGASPTVNAATQGDTVANMAHVAAMCDFVPLPSLLTGSK
jgi:hypothetical protein